MNTQEIQPRVPTRLLLISGMVVGPSYLAVGLAQAGLREGFDLGRHSLSVLANGSGGWIQTANFVLSGLMVIAAAVGIRRALRPHSRVAGWILGIYGLAMLAAAVFPADPVDGFPPGTPEGFPETISSAGLIHFAVGGLGFLALAISGLAVSVAMLRRRQPWVAGWSAFSGLAVIGGFFAPFLLPAAGPVAGIWFSVVIGWTWLALLSLYLYRANSP
ncbi:MAG: DUF998 domain-containing protein [Wenzhouxiangellaceae bacterium]